MEFLFMFVSLNFGLFCSGFLLDDRTSSTQPTGQSMSDKQFYMLMNLLTKEGNARLKLEDEIIQLKKELLVTQQGVTTNYHTYHRSNETLSMELDIMKEDMRKLVQNNSNLQMKYDLMKAELNEVKLNSTQTSNYARVLEEEIEAIKHLKIMADLQAIVNISIKANNIEHELKTTKTKLDSVVNDVNARKQDFIALFNKADLTEHNLDLTLKSMEKNFTSLTSQMETALNHSNSEISMLKLSQNISSSILESEVHSMSNRVAVTASAIDATYNNGEKIKFSFIRLNTGISNAVISSLKSVGDFKCEKSGLYLLSGFFMSDSTGTIQLAKNGNTVMYGYASVKDPYQTTTIIYLDNLQQNDIINFKESDTTRRIWGHQYSSISILQLTG